MPKSTSPRRKGRKVQPFIEKCDGSSEDEDIRLSQSGNRSYSSNDSYLKNINVRGDLSHHSDVKRSSGLNTSTSSETTKRSSRHNTSTSSNSDSPDGSVGTNTSRSPNSLYPSLEGLNNESFSEEEETNKNTFQDPSSEGYTGFVSLFVCFIILVLATIIIYLYSRDQNPPELLDKSALPPFDEFIGHVSNLEQSLPNQNKRLWRTIKASAMHVLRNTNPNYPVVILMASPIQYAHISRCIAKNITSGFELTKGLTPKESVVDITKLQHLDPAFQKQKLDEYLNSAFSSNQRKSFIIENLQLLHPEAALLLHGYCDNDNAPYKDVMMVLLLHIDEKDVTDFSSAAVESYLEQLWSRGLEVDKVKALLSRVANNVVTVETEDDKTFSKFCR